MLSVGLHADCCRYPHALPLAAHLLLAVLHRRLRYRLKLLGSQPVKVLQSEAA